LVKKCFRFKEGAMTKADLIEVLCETIEMLRKDSEIVVDTIFDGIVRSLRTEGKVEIRGFGSFRLRQRRSRIGRNPKTGARVEVPAKKIPYFKPGRELREGVNNMTTSVPGTNSEYDNRNIPSN
jgi:integration host factor subunit beta